MATAWIPKFTWNTHSATDSFEFTDPPINDPQNEEITANQSVFIASSGKPSVQLDSVTRERTLKFQWLSSSEKTSLEAFFDSWGAYGKSFRYYPDKDVATYYTVYLLEPTWKWSRPLPDGSGDFVYNLEIKLYEVKS